MVGLAAFLAGPLFDKGGAKRCDDAWPKISIVTPCLNQGRFLERTILSVLNQNYPNLEYILIDGGSSDESVDVIRKYEPFLSYCVSEADQGQGDAIAKGFRRATGQVLAWLNSDDIYLPGALSTIADGFRRSPSTPLIYGDCAVLDSKDAVLRMIYPIPFDDQIFLFENAIIAQPAAFWLREAYESVGGIDPRWRFCMDYDLWSRFMVAGMTFVHMPVALAGFRWHDSSKTMRLQEVNHREHGEIVARIAGRTRRPGAAKIAYLRMKRYAARPRALTEGLTFRIHEIAARRLRRLRGGRKCSP